MQPLADQLQAIRDQLDVADRDPISQRQIGRILIALGQLCDLVEQLAANQRQAQYTIDELGNS